MTFKKGHKISEETRRKMSLAHMGRTDSRLGKKHSQKTIQLYRDTRGGNKSPLWKGGRNINKDGYVMLWMPNNPNAIGAYVLEHRYIMQQHLERPLASWELVHHKNAVKDDNRLENLVLVTKQTHLGEVLCPHCNETFMIK